MYELMGLLTGGLGIFLLICFFLITSTFTSWLAARKGYSAAVWFFLGLFFGFLAFFAIGFAPDNTVNNIVSELNEIKRSLNSQSSEKNSLNKSTLANNPIINFNNEFWTCKKCGTNNPLVSNTCKDCGGYK